MASWSGFTGLLVLIMAAGCTVPQVPEERICDNCVPAFTDCDGPVCLASDDDPGTLALERRWDVDFVAIARNASIMMGPAVGSGLVAWTASAELFPSGPTGPKILQVYDSIANRLVRVAGNATSNIVAPMVSGGSVYFFDWNSPPGGEGGSVHTWRFGQEAMVLGQSMSPPSRVDGHWAAGGGLAWAMDLRNGDVYRLGQETSYAGTFPYHGRLYLTTGESRATLMVWNPELGSHTNISLPWKAAIADMDQDRILFGQLDSSDQPALAIMDVNGTEPNAIELPEELRCRTRHPAAYDGADLAGPWLAIRCAPFMDGTNRCKAYNLETGAIVNMGQAPGGLHNQCLLDESWMWTQCMDGLEQNRIRGICRVALPA